MSAFPRSGRVLVTSGPTRAWIDRVRFIANTSSGALGARIVESLIARGIPVLHLIGLGAECPSVSSPLLESWVTPTIDDLIAGVHAAAGRGDIRGVVHAMAVLDYAPERSMGEKRASDTEEWDIRLVRTPKVSALIRETMPEACFVGFKLEAGISEEELVRRALASLRKHRLDLVVANDLDRVGPDAHEALFIAPDGTVLSRSSTKRDIAEYIAGFIGTNTGLGRG